MRRQEVVVDTTQERREGFLRRAIRFGRRRYDTWSVARAERRALRLEVQAEKDRLSIDRALEHRTAYLPALQDNRNPIDHLADLVQREREEEESGIGRGKFSWLTFAMFASKVALGAAGFYLLGENLEAVPLVGDALVGAHDFFYEVLVSTGLTEGGAGLGAAIAMSVTTFGIFSGVVYADRRLTGGRIMNAMSRVGEGALRTLSGFLKWLFGRPANTSA